MSLVNELQRRFPGAEFSVIGGDIVWHGDGAPSPEEIADARLAVLRDDKSAEIAADFAAACDAIRAGYAPDEIQSWPQQQAQAEAYAADNNAVVPLLTAMAKARGVAVDVLASRIIANAATYSAAYGQALGIKQARQDALDAALTIAQIEAI